MASLLAIATVFVGLWTLNIYILQSEKEGGPIRETINTTLCKNVGGELMREGGAYLWNSTVLHLSMYAHE